MAHPECFSLLLIQNLATQFRLSIGRKKETLTEGVPVTAEYIYNNNYGTIFVQIALFLIVISLVSRKKCVGGK